MASLWFFYFAYGGVLKVIPDKIIISTLCLFQLFFLLTIFIPHRGDESPGFFLQFLTIVILFQVFFFNLSDNITSFSIKLSGLGLQKRCFYDEDLKKNKIPEEFTTPVRIPNSNPDKKYSSVYIVANPGNVFYLSKDNKQYTAEFRFVDDNLPEISCVAASAVDPKISH
ncbi:hypothetical protein EHW66_19170 [Erwinia psidii]|uniref:hypothetical protein n=1 Tax=Erwinia psidii TaxID=69224 RepID=UPI00226AFE92|nr:hypothetical protein [Erwinia psidii]MCX8967019.1 hypothetical protein [Erwinia psidii]